jgi:multiple sugar transport system permease protein
MRAGALSSRSARQSCSLKFLLHFLMIAIMLLYVGPLLWMISLSLKTAKEVYSYPPKIFPNRLQLHNYYFVIFTSRIPVFTLNSFKITLLTAIGNLLVTAPAAFAFSRYRFKFRKALLFLILAFDMISPLVVTIPLYQYYNSLNLLNSHIGIVLLYITIRIPFTVWIIKGFFDSIPKELDESAMMEGCNSRIVFLRIILPLSTTGVSAAVLFNTVFSWGHFIIPYVFLSKDHLFPIAVGILYFVDHQTEGLITTQYMAAATVLGLFPPVMILAFLQRYVVKIVTAGALKG